MEKPLYVFFMLETEDSIKTFFKLLTLYHPGGFAIIFDQNKD